MLSFYSNLLLLKASFNIPPVNFTHDNPAFVDISNTLWVTFYGTLYIRSYTRFWTGYYVYGTLYLTYYICEMSGVVYYIQIQLITWLYLELHDTFNYQFSMVNMNLNHSRSAQNMFHFTFLQFVITLELNCFGNMCLTKYSENSNAIVNYYSKVYANIIHALQISR